MSTNVTEQAIRDGPVHQSSPPEPSVSTVDADIPESIPATETTIYRDPKTVIRIRPTQSATDEVCLTMYRHITEETKALTPEGASNWCEESFDTSPNTIKALPELIADRYVAIVEALTDSLRLSVVHPSTGDGICHRRHDSLGKHGVVSFQTRLG